MDPTNTYSANPPSGGAKPGAPPAAAPVQVVHPVHCVHSPPSPPSPWLSLDALRRLGRAAGFDLIGATPAEPLADFDYYRVWLDRGFHGQMDYLERGAEARRTPKALLPEAQTVVVCALNYLTANPAGNACGSASAILRCISRYAWGLDYHAVVRRRLKRLHRMIEMHLGRPVRAQLCVDTAPLLERALAVRAGLGWIGKNCCLIHPRFGSFLFLGELLLDLQTESGVPVAERCGRCERCVRACPTGALAGPRCLDARRCVAYQTIESKSGEPPEVGGYLYGCDICQNVCPWNVRAQRRLSSDVREFRPLPHLAAAQWEDLDFPNETAFRDFFRGSVIRRIGLKRWKANLARTVGGRAQKSLETESPDGQSP